MIKNSKSVKESTVKKNLPVTLNKQCVSLLRSFLELLKKMYKHFYVSLCVCVCFLSELYILQFSFFYF